MSKKFTIEEVRKIFQDKGCVLKEDKYINNRTPMDYICSCGDNDKITLHNLKSGQKCKRCAIEKRKSKLKFSYEYVYNYFKEYDCELLEKCYKNSHTKMKYRCSCGNISQIMFSSFQQGQRCRKCSGKEKLSYEYVYNYFKRHNCQLLEDKYINCHEKMKYICECGNKSEISFSSFKQGHRCFKCSRKKLAKKFRYSIEYVREVFKENGCILISTEYENVNSKLKFICSCGNIATCSFRKFREGQRCFDCGEKKKKKRMRHSYEYVKEYFEKKGCILTSKEYIKGDEPLDYICSCGNKSKITFYSLHNGSKCNKCGVERTKGEKSVHWNPNLTDEDRISRRHIPGYQDWVNSIFVKDNYTCHKCSQHGGDLNAHHIYNYSTHKLLRTDKNNGLTLCKDCHTEFHSKYSNKNNNLFQLCQFLGNYDLITCI
jgi:hypothetical protein